MTAAAMDRLEASAGALAGALDARDAEALLPAAAEFRAAVEAVRGLAPSGDRALVEAQLRRAAGLAAAAEMRVRILTDANRRRLAAVAALRGEAPALYGREGR